jgi:phospholipase/lecithinase/hemolysin
MLSRQIHFLVVGFLLSAAFCCGAQAHRWQSLYVFGDSYSDSGAGYVDGNGPTSIAYAAENLGIPFTYAGDPNSAGKGLNFAVSGAQTGSGEGHRFEPKPGGPPFKEALLGYGMRNQVADFTKQVKSGAIHFDTNRTVFFIAGGLNDRNSPTATTIANLEDEIREVYDDGGRYFLVALMPTKIAAFSAPAIRLNPAIAKIPDDLKSTLPGAHVALSKWGEYFDQVMENPAQFGITNVTDRCAGRALFGEDTTPCASPDTYFFYHQGHPSTAVHKIVGRELARELESAFAAK